MRLGRRTTLTIAGGALVAVGVILIPFPILPGIPVVIAGAALLRKAWKSKPDNTAPVAHLPEPPDEISSETASA